MLTLSRKVNEAIMIDGGRIVVRILSVEGGKVRLGITAPKEVAIDREEIHAAKVASGKWVSQKDLKEAEDANG